MDAHRQDVSRRHVDDVAGGESQVEPAIGHWPGRDARIASVELGPKGLQAVQADDVARSEPLVLSLQRGEAQSRCRCAAKPLLNMWTWEGRAPGGT